MPITHQLVFRLLDDALEHFHKRYPNEDPFIRIVCMRKKRYDDDSKLEKQWRKITIDETGRNEVIIDPPKIRRVEITTKKNTDNITQKMERKIQRNNGRIEDIITTAEDMNLTTKILVETPLHGGEIVLDSIAKPYDHKIFVSSAGIVEKIHVKSVEKLDIPTGTVLGMDDVGMIQASITEISSQQIKTLDEKEYFQVIKTLEAENQKLKDQLWKMGNRIRSSSSVDEDMIKKNIQNLKQYVIETKMVMEQSLSQMMAELQLLKNDDILDKVVEVSDKEKKNLIGNKTIREICDGYVQIQKKLGILKTEVIKEMGPMMAEFKNIINEKGFLLSLPLIIKKLNKEGRDCAKALKDFIKANDLSDIMLNDYG